MDPNPNSNLPRPTTVFMLCKDAARIAELSSRLADKGLAVRGFRSIAGLRDGIEPTPKAILLLDSRVLSEPHDVPRLLDDLARRLGTRPALVYLAHSTDIELRLDALRAGAAAFYAPPVATEELVRQLLELSGVQVSRPYRVLVVDDQPVAAVFASRVLESVGMETCIAGDALRVLDTLEEFRPDLVLMDLHMPGADGIELTTLIRERDERYDIPVIFLSAELDMGKQMDALRVGGDDFIAKPVSPERLIERVRHSIESCRSVNSRRGAVGDRGGITGLMSRSAFLKRIDALISRGTDQGPGNGVLMVEFDASENGRDQMAPGSSDGLFARLLGVMPEHLDARECAARFAAGSIAILARRESDSALCDLAHSLRNQLAAIAETEDGAGAGRVRIGVGLFRPRVDDALTMISRAEQACARAREGGGSRVGVYAPSVPTGADPEREAWLADMVEGALGSGGFRLLYQPIVPLRRVAGERYEATPRLMARDGEYIPAFDFLPAARRRGLIPAIDRWVMGHALDELKQQRNAHRRLQFFIHQSVETLCTGDWSSWLRNQIVERDLIKQRPVLQFQLDDLVANPGSAARGFDELRRLSIKTCVIQPEDDPSVLRLVEELGISLLRLPHPTIAAMDATRLTWFVEQLHGLGCEVIAARIEHPQHIARVWNCGVDFIQGNFLQFPTQGLSFDFSESSLAG